MFWKKVERVPDLRCWSLMLARRILSSSVAGCLRDWRLEKRAAELRRRGPVLEGDEGALDLTLVAVSSMALSAWKFAMLSEERAMSIYPPS
jgi:hypothetical protein